MHAPHQFARVAVRCCAVAMQQHQHATPDISTLDRAPHAIVIGHSLVILSAAQYQWRLLASPSNLQGSQLWSLCFSVCSVSLATLNFDIHDYADFKLRAALEAGGGY